MNKYDNVIVFRDGIGSFPPGYVFYPESLKLIIPILRELNNPEMQQPKYFNANLMWLLDLIVTFLALIHDTHNAAKIVYEQYRAGGLQYCLSLRSFMLSGMTINIDLERNRHLFGWAGGDRDFAAFVRENTDGRINSLSFVNTHDVRSADDAKQPKIPSFRVVSHNWRDIVREVVRGAKFIILNLEDETEGVREELELIRECGMSRRTICVTPYEPKHDYSKAFSDVYDVIKVPAGPFSHENAEVERLKRRIEDLTNDDFVQTNQVRDLTDLRCYVVDRHIDLAASQFSPEQLSGVAYEDFVPSSLLSNWNVFATEYRAAFERWEKLVNLMRAREFPKGDDLAFAMYKALTAFYLSVTLERNEEAAKSLGLVGLTHELLTNQSEIKNDCYKHAAKFATWSEDPALAESYK